MQTPASHRSLELSQKLYQRLLAAYPRPHREEYGGAMAQLFRDQCRDAWAEGRTLGLAALWWRILPELIKTSFIERFATLHPRKFMSDKLTAFLRPRHSPMFTFLVVFIVVFLLVLSLGVVITFILPESYASTTRIKVETQDSVYNSNGQQDNSYDPYFIQTTFEIIQSQLVLSNVVSELNLNVAWGKKYYGGERLKTTETMEILKHRLNIQPVRNTRLIAITVYSDDRNEAAQIANAIAESYQEYRLKMRRQLKTGELKSLEEQYADFETKVHASQTYLDGLRGQLNISDNDPNSLDWSPSLTGSMVQTYDAQMIEGKKTYKQLQTQLDELKALSRDKLRQTLPTVVGDNMLPDLLVKLLNAEQQLSTLTNNYAPANPKVITCATMIDTLNEQIDARVSGIMAGLKSVVNAKKSALEALTDAVAQAKTNDQLKQAREQPYWEAKRGLERLLDFQKILAAKIEEEKLDLEIPKDSLVEITDLAEPGDAPVKPNKSLNIAISAIAGVFMGAICGSVAALFTLRREKRRNTAVPGTAA